MNIYDNNIIFLRCSQYICSTCLHLLEALLKNTSQLNSQTNDTSFSKHLSLDIMSGVRQFQLHSAPMQWFRMLQ